MTKIVNLSLQSSTMPLPFKSAILIPLLKKPGLELVKSNFRPVSNVAYASKLIESAVASQLVEHLTRNRLFDPLQSAYRQGHSTETALLEVQSDMLEAMDNKKVSILVFLDLSAAFDTVDHKFLLKRLKDRCGVQKGALQWFDSYLSKRSQMVKLNDVLSKSVSLNCGLRQGSVLWPLLFLIYTLPLGGIVQSMGLQYHLYADDTQIYMSCVPNNNDVVYSLKRIEMCIQVVNSWMSANSLKLNGDKTKLMLIGTPRQYLKVSNVILNVADNSIGLCQKEKNLGVLFDKHLNLKSHVNMVCRSARYHLHNISLARRFLTKDVAAKAIQAFVISRLDSNNALLHGLPSCELKKIQRVQNAAARLLVGAKRSCHITPILKDLHWLSVVCRIKYKILLFTFKCMKKLAPDYLANLLKKCIASRATRSATDRHLLETKRTHLVTAGERSFAHVAPKLWNELPYSLRASNSLLPFKKLLKTYLFQSYF